MPQMIKEITLISAMVALSLVVVAKADKQFVHMLEGKLFRLKQNVSLAARVYRNHTRRSAVLFFILGFSAIGLSAILLSENNRIFMMTACASIVLLGLGIKSRINSFRAADRELDNYVDRQLR